MKLSIITVNKNNAEGLERTCQSVECQNYDNFEWIVIDGGGGGCSTDNSVDVIKKYSHKMAYWVSEPDTGIYNAMNKGIRLAKGDYCLFLNSGDWLINSYSLKNAFDIIADSEDAEIYYANCLTSDYTFWGMPEPLTIDSLFLQIAPNHQNTLIKRSLFYEHEFYDEKYRTVSDSIFFAKEFWLYHSKFCYLKTILSMYETNGISNTYKPAKQELHDEMKRIMGENKYNALVKRAYPNPKPKFLRKIIKFILPYGVVRFIQIYFIERKK